MATFEGYERRIEKINSVLPQYGIDGIDGAKAVCDEAGVDVRSIVQGIQPIAFENAVWAYTLGSAIAVRNGSKSASEAAEAIGLGLQAFCIPGSVADQRKVGVGHGTLRQCCFVRKRAASRFSRAMRALPLLKAP